MAEFKYKPRIADAARPEKLSRLTCSAEKEIKIIPYY